MELYFPEQPDIRGNMTDMQEYKPGSNHQLGCCLCREPGSPVAYMQVPGKLSRSALSWLQYLMQRCGL